MSWWLPAKAEWQCGRHLNNVYSMGFLLEILQPSVWMIWKMWYQIWHQLWCLPAKNQFVWKWHPAHEGTTGPINLCVPVRVVPKRPSQCITKTWKKPWRWVWTPHPGLRFLPKSSTQPHWTCTWYDASLNVAKLEWMLLMESVHQHLPSSPQRISAHWWVLCF